MRKIIHIDMDAFFAAVEQRDNPQLRGKPVAVGGSGRRGVVASASYEARRFGVRSAMPGSVALRLCPELIFVKPRFEVYKAVSQQIRAIFWSYTDLVEPLSLDEAYLDVTANLRQLPSATATAEAIRREILATTQLTASAGVSFNKFLAKIASDLNKPNGIKVIRPAEAPDFIANLPIEKFHGVGKVTAQKMHQLGIKTGQDLLRFGEPELLQRFGKAGAHYYRIVRANDERPVNPHRERKSLGAERTFAEDLSDLATLQARLVDLADLVFERLAHSGQQGRTVTLKLKTADFRLFTRRTTLTKPPTTAAELAAIGCQLLEANHPQFGPIRLLGLTISNFGSSLTPSAPSGQLQLDLD